MPKSLDTIEKSTFDEDDSTELPPPDIIAYNELRSCADLYRMHTNHILEIQPEFQREVVWPIHARTRFIDSLVKQLPIPSMCFSLDYKLQKWQVIDGLQRMASIINFLSGAGWTLSQLPDIDPKLSGKPVSKFLDRNSELHQYYTRVENLTLPITVIRCDYQKKSHMNYLFTIFHRLNTGGMKLNNQEIRNCIFSGPFNELLKKLNTNDAWMKINRMKRATGYRFIKQELILRLFAFHDVYNSYGGHLASFLNDYMKDHRDPGSTFLEGKSTFFNKTVEIVNNYIFEGKIPRKLPVSIIEAVMVGVSLNLAFLESQNRASIQAMYTRLLNDPEFSEERLVEGLSGKARVIGRMQTAQRIFSTAK